VGLDSEWHGDQGDPFCQPSQRRSGGGQWARASPVMAAQGGFRQGARRDGPRENPDRAPKLGVDQPPARRAEGLDPGAWPVSAATARIKASSTPPGCWLFATQPQHHGRQTATLREKTRLDDAPAIASRGRTRCLWVGAAWPASFKPVFSASGPHPPTGRGCGLGHEAAHPQRQAQTWGGALSAIKQGGWWPRCPSFVSLGKPAMP